MDYQRGECIIEIPGRRWLSRYRRPKSGRVKSETDRSRLLQNPNEVFDVLLSQLSTVPVFISFLSLKLDNYKRIQLICFDKPLTSDNIPIKAEQLEIRQGQYYCKCRCEETGSICRDSHCWIFK